MVEQPRSQVPVFESYEDDRDYRKRHLVAALRLFGRNGWGDGTAGHISARDPELPDHFWVNPYGVHFSKVQLSDLVLVNDEGDVVEGDRPVNRAAFAIHSSIHAARPEVVSAAHAHTTHGVAWASLGRLLSPISQDVCSFYEDHVLFEDFTGVILDPEDGARLAKALGTAKALILRNHGLLTVGETVDAAAWWFLKMERACEVELLARAAGDPHLIDPDTAKLVHEQSGNPRAGWFSFQPLYDLLAQQQPEMFE